MKPTLLVLAAGMGSRYGGLKQIDPMGPSGETILDYSVFDALRAGFGKPHGAGFAEPPARRADNGLAAGNSEIHETPSNATIGAEVHALS